MINKVILMGRLTRDPEIRHTSNDKIVANFTVAVENGYGDKKQTDFINCVAWNNQAEFLGKYFTKGMMIIVAGRISTRTWEGQDGRKNYVTEVLANEISFGETKKQQGQNRQAEQEPDNQKQLNNPEFKPVEFDQFNEEFVPLDEIDDDLPFN